MKHDKIFIKSIARGVEKEWFNKEACSILEFKFAIEVAVRYADALLMLEEIPPPPKPEWLTPEIILKVKSLWQNRSDENGSTKAQAIKYIMEIGEVNPVDAHWIIRKYCINKKQDDKKSRT